MKLKAKEEEQLTSHAYTFTSDRPLAAKAAAMPHVKPPPPNGATTVVTSGRSCRISRPTVAFPDEDDTTNSSL